MLPRRKNFKPAKDVRGVSLIEVLISVLVMGIGMLGIAAMQATALRNSQSALERSQAVIQSYTVLDAMRSNVVAARTGLYNMGMTCGAVAGGDLPATDRNSWITSLKETMGATACGAINCNVNVCRVTVQWDDSRGTGSAAAVEQQFETVTRL